MPSLIEGIHIKHLDHSECSIKEADDLDGGDEALEPKPEPWHPHI